MSSENIKQGNPLAEEKIGRLIARFAVPAIISMLVSSLYNIVDQIFIGQGVGMLGNAATNIAFPVSIICTATALLLGIGSASNYNLEAGRGEMSVRQRLQAMDLPAGNLWRVNWCDRTDFLESIAASVWCDEGDFAICAGLYRNYGNWHSVSDPHYRR